MIDKTTSNPDLLERVFLGAGFELPDVRYGRAVVGVLTKVVLDGRLDYGDNAVLDLLKIRPFIDEPVASFLTEHAISTGELSAAQGERLNHAKQLVSSYGKQGFRALHPATTEKQRAVVSYWSLQTIQSTLSSDMAVGFHTPRVERTVMQLLGSR